MKNIIITGAGKGMGKATALRLGKTNNLLAISRTESNLVALKEELGKNFEYVVGDINKEADRQKLFVTAKKFFPKIDVLINNAGIYYEKPINKVEPEKIDELFNTDIISMIKLTRLFSEVFMAQKSGQIINTSSVAGLEGYAENTVYCAVKFAVTGFTKALAQDLRPFGVRVTALYPDYVNNAGDPHTDGQLECDDIATLVETIINLPSYVVVEEIRVRAIEDYK